MILCLNMKFPRKKRLNTILKTSLELSPALFYLTSFLFILGVGLGLTLDVINQNPFIIIKTAVGFILILSTIILGALHIVNRNMSLGIVIILSSLIWMIESFLVVHHGTELLINFLSNLVILSAFLTAGGFLVSKLLAVGMGLTILLYTIFTGFMVTRQFPSLEYYIFFFVFVLIGLIFIVFHYRIQLENHVLHLHASREALENKNRLLSVLKDESDTALSNLKTAHKHLMSQEKMVSLGAMSSGIAQEVQYPIRAVNAEAAAVLDSLEDLDIFIQEKNSQKASQILDNFRQALLRIQQHSNHATQITKDLELQSRSGFGDFTFEPINELLQESQQLAYHAMKAQVQDFSCRVSLDLEENIGVIRIIRPDIIRVSFNLLTNAFHAVQEKKLHLNNLDYEPHVIIRTRKTGSDISITFEDNGIGIHAELQDKIFDPFFTSKPTGKGTGLGLSVSKEIIEQIHGGKLNVQVEKNGPTRFTLILPISS